MSAGMIVLAPPGLAERIQAAHQAAQAGARTALENAILCGELLLQAKRQVGHGAWAAWVERHLSFGLRQAQKYMRATQHREALAANANSSSHLTAAMAVLAEPRQAVPLPWTGEEAWFTPIEFVEAARAVLGAIDVDPASCEAAQQVVQAATYYTAETDGLAQTWKGRLFINPPYKSGLIEKFVSKLIDEHRAGNVSEAVLLVHSRTDASWFHDAARAAAAVCFTRGRIKFWTPDGTGDAPTTGSVLHYYGDRPERFAKVFADFGTVYGPPVGAAAVYPARLELAA